MYDTTVSSQPLSLTQPAAAALGWISERCLQSHPWRQACTACLGACPVQALSFDKTQAATDTFTTGDARRDAHKSLRLLASDRCHGCGRCVAACPTEALLSSEHQQLTPQFQTAADASQTPQIGCHRVAASGRSHSVHCLLSLSEEQLMTWQKLFPHKPLNLRVPDDCAQCSAQDSEISEFPQWLTVKTSPPALEYQAAGAPALSRRQLFTRASRATRPTYAAEDRQPAPRRLHRHYAARQRVDFLPALRLPQVHLNSQACDAQGLCSRLCPSQALVTRSDGSLNFNRLQCLGCNQCVDVCPEQALSLTFTTAETHEPLAQELRTSRKERCFECGHEFVLPPQQTDTKEQQDSPHICPACRKDRQLMQGGFASLFG